jgi:hypothetical protein
VSNFIENEPLRAGTAVHIAWNALVPKRFVFNAKPVLEHPERRFTAAALPPRTPAVNDLRLSESVSGRARSGISSELISIVPSFERQLSRIFVDFAFHRN